MAKKFNPWSAYWETMRAMNAATLTIGVRTLRMQQAFARGDFAPDAEGARMVTEKIKATTDGYAAGARVWSAAMRSMSPATTAADVATVAARAGMASVRPAYAKARANARRLSGRS